MKKLLIAFCSFLILSACSEPVKKSQGNGNGKNRQGKNRVKNSGSNTSSYPDYSAGTQSESSSSTAPAVLPGNENGKQHMVGLMVRQFDWIDSQNPDVEFLKVVNHIVVRVNWNDLEPNEGTLNTTAIDNALRFAADMKSKYGVDLYYKLRVVTGIFSPDWLMQKAGYFSLSTAKLDKESPKDDKSPVDAKCPKFWTKAYQDAWASLQVRLAAKYDANPIILEVINSGTSATSGEALIRGPKKNYNAYMSTGYTKALDMASVYASIRAMTPWKQTNIGMCITPIQNIGVNTGEEEEIQTTQKIIDSLGYYFGSRVCVGNNGLRTADAAKSGDDWRPGGIMFNLQQQFAAARVKYGMKIYYQLATEWRQGGNEGIAGALNRGADEFKVAALELPGSEKKIKEGFSLAQLSSLNGKLMKN